MPNSKSPDACTKIESSFGLEKVLQLVDQPLEKICHDLEVSRNTCNKLKHQGELRPDTIAQYYIQQYPQACWETIAKLLCQDYRLKRLAIAEVVERRIEPPHASDATLSRYGCL